MYYRVIDNKVYDRADWKYHEECLYTSTCTQKEYDAEENQGKYLLDGTSIIIDPQWEEKQAEKERIRIGNLTCTKRVFILMLEELQYNYFETILPMIEANRQAKLEWELCVELQRNNPLIDQLASQLSITSEQLDNLFKYANGEITLEEFKSLNN